MRPLVCARVPRVTVLSGRDGCGVRGWQAVGIRGGCPGSCGWLPGAPSAAAGHRRVSPRLCRLGCCLRRGAGPPSVRGAGTARRLKASRASWGERGFTRVPVLGWARGVRVRIHVVGGAWCCGGFLRGPAPGRAAPRGRRTPYPVALLALCRHLPCGKTSTEPARFVRTVLGGEGCGGRPTPRLAWRAPGPTRGGAPATAVVTCP